MKYYVGIDLGGTNIKAGVVDEEYHILGRGKKKTSVPAIVVYFLKERNSYFSLTNK